MADMTRRTFIKHSAWAAGTLMVASNTKLQASPNTLGPVPLGTSGIQVPRVALGTGSHGWQRSSQQTRLGQSKFLDLAQHAYDEGIRFFESADIYGSHQFIGEALKYVPRDKVIIETKIWHRPVDWIDYKNATQTVDRFRREIGTDYLDIVLLHCQVEEDWTTKYRREMDELNELQAKGIVGTVGVSCHDFGALQSAVNSEWVEVIQARINAYGPKMDAEPEKVMPLLKQAHDAGKGIIGMKIFGCGDCIAEEQRQTSLEYVWNSGNVDSITIGFSEHEHIDDSLKRIKAILS